MQIYSHLEYLLAGSQADGVLGVYGFSHLEERSPIVSYRTEMNGRRLFPVPNVCRNFVGMPNNFLDEYISYLLLTFLRFLRL